jgi:pilus assembly protein CpaB
MGARRILILLLGLVVAGATALYARAWIEGQHADRAVAAPVPVEDDRTEVLVADVALGAGAFVQPQHLRWQRWPTDDVPTAYAVRGARTEDAFIGAVVRRGLSAGQPITDGVVVKPGERGFLAAVLEPGTRAVSVPINATSGNSGLIFPGDRVDLILTQTLSPEEGPSRRVSETVLEGIRVIAMGDQTSDETGEGKSHEGARTATLEVTPGQAEAVALVTELGKLSLSLRSLARDGEDPPLVAEPRPFTWDSDVSQVLRSGGSLTVLRGRESEAVAVEKGASK